MVFRGRQFNHLSLISVPTNQLQVWLPINTMSYCARKLGNYLCCLSMATTSKARLNIDFPHEFMFCMTSGSHMCDTKGYLAKQHLVVETWVVNNRRRLCTTILLHIHDNPLIHFSPCPHGNQYLNDPLQYSCRRIQTIITNQSDFWFIFCFLPLSVNKICTKTISHHPKQ